MKAPRPAKAAAGKPTAAKLTLPTIEAIHRSISWLGRAIIFASSSIEAAPAGLIRLATIIQINPAIRARRRSNLTSLHAAAGSPDANAPAQRLAAPGARRPWRRRTNVFPHLHPENVCEIKRLQASTDAAARPFRSAIQT
jgi:hypothetical protein